MSPPVTDLTSSFKWAPPDLAAELRAGVLEVRGVWPAIALALDVFDAHAQRVWSEPASPAPAEGGRATERPTVPVRARVRDLWLACACAAGDPEAVRVLDQNVLKRVAPALRGMRQGQDFIDEVLQRAREQLVLGMPAREGVPRGEPKIAQYQGLGPLERWVRVFVVRLALQILRGHDAPVSDDEGSPDGDAPAPDIEREHLRARYGNWFRDTLKRVFAELPDDDKKLVELVVQARLPLSEIGQRLGLDKSTISRRMTAVRVRMFDALQKLAQSELRVAPGDYASLVAALRSQLDLSLGLVAKTPPDRPS